MRGHEVVPIIKALAPRLPVIITAPENSQELEVKVRRASIFLLPRQKLRLGS